MGSPLLYGTHIPLLKIVAANFCITSVIEFGCGNYSTLTFLNKKIFKDLKSIVSLECKKKWYKIIKRKVKDNRFKIIYNNEEKLLEIAKTHAPSDLVFVDGKSRVMREKTAFYGRNFSDLVILHDAENPEYKRAIQSYKFCYLYTKLLPNTAVLSDSIDLSKSLD